ncbi:MAG: WYL domain-containing protein [Lachnospiraceae bacterium]|nr:WYL domain-containing protein [Lachnospiraceae bacterium]
MSKSYNQKMKILNIMKILLEKTDENHVITMPEIILELENIGIKAERKSIYDDMEALRLFGLDIINRKGHPAGYYIASRQFGMFDGHTTDVDILLENRFVGVVIDRFGKDVTIRKHDEEHFVAKVKVVVSNQFYGWLTGLGVGVKLIAPDSVVNENRIYLENLIKQYK